MTNDALFVKVLAQIEREPKRWKQGAWKCGTAYCMAGWVCVLSGDRIDSCYTQSGEFVPRAAEAHLGLPNHGSWMPNSDEALFSSTNSLDDLYRLSADLMGIDVEVLKDKVRAEVTP